VRPLRWFAGHAAAFAVTPRATATLQLLYYKHISFRMRCMTDTAPDMQAFQNRYCGSGHERRRLATTTCTDWNAGQFLGSPPQVDYTTAGSASRYLWTNSGRSVTLHYGCQLPPHHTHAVLSPHPTTRTFLFGHGLWRTLDLPHHLGRTHY